MHRLVVAAALALPAVGQSAVALNHSIGSPIAYDSVRNRAVVFTAEGELFEYEGALRLHRANTAPNGPGRRSGPGLVFDPVRRHVLLFGGSSTATFDDTWVWDGASWRELQGPRPPSRARPGIAFDTVRGRVVMYGGLTRSGFIRQDTWEHDGVQWSQGAPTTVPPPTTTATMCFDSGRGVTVMTLGSGTIGVPSTTWEWNGLDWTQRVTAQGPPTDNGPAMAYDPVRRRCVSLGGGLITILSQLVATPGREVWEYDGTNWALAATLAAPLRGFCSAWYDAGANAVVVAGGPEPTSGTTAFEFAQWNGAALTVTARSELPSPRSSMTIGGAADGMLLFGGTGNVFTGTGVVRTTLGDTWTWLGQDWRRETPSRLPPARTNGAMCYRRLTGSTMMFGGADPTTTWGDCWLWSSGTWTPQPQGPPARVGAVMVEDLAHGEVVLFGGSSTIGQQGVTLLADTWVFDGTSWTARLPLQSPSARMDAACAFDLVRSTAILFGGFSGVPGNTYLADTWSWDGRTWTQMTTAHAPRTMSSPRMEFSFAAATVQLGGSVANLAQMWELQGNDWFRVGRPVDDSSFGVVAANQATFVPTWFDGTLVREWTETPATAAATGLGCGAPAPRLALRARPRSGEPNSGLELATAPGLPVLFAVDGAAANIALGGGCNLLVGPTPALFFAASDARGLAVLPWAVPLDARLRSVPVFAQAGVLDAQQPAGFAVSGALDIRVGD